MGILLWTLHPLNKDLSVWLHEHKQTSQEDEHNRKDLFFSKYLTYQHFGGVFVGASSIEGSAPGSYLLRLIQFLKVISVGTKLETRDHPMTS